MHDLPSKHVGVMLDPGNQTSEGWSRGSVPLHEGIVDWHKVGDALRLLDFEGTFVFMPFYNRDDPLVMTENLKKEVAHFSDLFSSLCDKKQEH